MRLGVLFDENGDFAGDCLEGQAIPEGYSLVLNEDLPETLYVGPTKRPKLVGGVIDQSEAQAEVEALASAPQPETAEEKIDRLETELSNARNELTVAQQSILDSMDATFELYLAVLNLQPQSGGESE